MTDSTKHQKIQRKQIMRTATKSQFFSKNVKGVTIAMNAKMAKMQDIQRKQKTQRMQKCNDCKNAENEKKTKNHNCKERKEC